MTLCNMAAEFGAFSAVVAPDETTMAWIRGRPFTPQGSNLEQAQSHWRTLFSDADARWDQTLHMDVSDVVPHVTWGTNPGLAVAIDGRIPAQPVDDPAAMDVSGRALRYMQLQAGQQIAGVPIEAAFIGSCTNSRIEDLRAAAAVVKGRSVSVKRVMVVPGSHQVKKQAEAEGLDKIFIAAGIDWREPGCSMCLAMNPDKLAPGERAASTSNRNFEGRQGRGGRTHLVSPEVAAATAVAGHFATPGDLA
jgi:3-isopropylmalate/(R)-2-methylmalate dehydratase large subunit